jgi:pilus assembly protein CpaE
MVDMSSDVVLVTMRDTLALKNAKLGLETLERMGYDQRRVRTVLNRANTNVGIEPQDILAILNRDADVLIPSHRDVTLAMNQGQPLARSSSAGKAFGVLAQLYIDDSLSSGSRNETEVSATNGRRRSLFRRRR